MTTYTVQNVYQISDFDTSGSRVAPTGAQEQGNRPFDIALNSGATALQLKVTDDDGGFNEFGCSNQVLARAITLDGADHPAGTSIVINNRFTGDTGFKGYAITIGTGKSDGNDATVFMTNSPMVPSQTYVFSNEGNTTNHPAPYSEFACFTAGSMIKTALGERPIEDIAAGDRVMTRDHGLQTVRWVGARTIPAFGDMAPIVFEEGTLGCSARLLVSPNHRMLITGAMAELVCGDDELLISAKLLVNDRNVRRIEGGFVNYVHIMFDYHEVIWANDCPSESFYAGDQAINRLNTEQAREILAIFPDLRSGTKEPSLARAEGHGYEGIVIGATL
jgi:hypothetical protein